MHTHLISSTAFPERYTLLSRREACEYLRRTVKTLDLWTADGMLPVVRIGTRVLIRRSVVTSYYDVLNPDWCAERPAEPLPPKSAYVSLNGAAELLRIHRSTVDALTMRGELPRMRFGRSRVIPARALCEFIDSHSRAATAGPLAGLES